MAGRSAHVQCVQDDERGRLLAAWSGCAAAEASGSRQSRPVGGGRTVRTARATVLADIGVQPTGGMRASRANERAFLARHGAFAAAASVEDLGPSRCHSLVVSHMVLGPAVLANPRVLTTLQ